MKKLNCLIISDFNAQNLSDSLNASEDSQIKFVAKTTAFDQVVQSLVNPNQIDFGQDPDFLVIWTQLERVSPTFRRALHFEKVLFKQAFAEVDELSSFIIQNKQNPKFIFIPTWVLPSQYRGHGVSDYQDGVGIRDLLFKMNARLRENLKANSNIYILDTSRWIETAGKNAFSPQMWYLAKMPFGTQVFQSASLDLHYYCKALYGLNRKLILLDLDETLWGGVVGEDGLENLKIGGHDPLGEAHLDFQKALKSLKNRGILLAIVSKNDEKMALEVFDRHPEMILKKTDFVGWKINWQEKSKNISELLAEINLSLDSAVLIDDSPVERLKVKSILPDVEVPEWPQDKMLYASTLLGLPYFDTLMVSQEDAERTDLYATNQARKNSITEFSSSDDWLKSLETNVICEEVNEINFGRVVQLMNKTNQMNLSTRRLNETELKLWLESHEHRMWTFRALDKFGDLGLIGIASIEVQNSKAKLIDFVLSCRAMGRKIEETMLHVICRHAQQMKLKETEAFYLPTSKNTPCLLFFKNSGFHEKEKEKGKIFTWNLRQNFPLSASIRLKFPPLAEAVVN